MHRRRPIGRGLPHRLRFRGLRGAHGLQAGLGLGAQLPLPAAELAEDQHGREQERVPAPARLLQEQGLQKQQFHAEPSAERAGRRTALLEHPVHAAHPLKRRGCRHRQVPHLWCLDQFGGPEGCFGHARVAGAGRPGIRRQGPADAPRKAEEARRALRRAYEAEASRPHGRCESGLGPRSGPEHRELLGAGALRAAGRRGSSAGVFRSLPAPGRRVLGLAAGAVVPDRGCLERPPREQGHEGDMCRQRPPRDGLPCGFLEPRLPGDHRLRRGLRPRPELPLPPAEHAGDERGRQRRGARGDTVLQRTAGAGGLDSTTACRVAAEPEADRRTLLEPCALEPCLGQRPPLHLSHIHASVWSPHARIDQRRFLVGSGPSPRRGTAARLQPEFGRLLLRPPARAPRSGHSGVSERAPAEQHRRRREGAGQPGRRHGRPLRAGAARLHAELPKYDAAGDPRDAVELFGREVRRQLVDEVPGGVDPHLADVRPLPPRDHGRPIRRSSVAVRVAALRGELGRSRGGGLPPRVCFGRVRGPHRPYPANVHRQELQVPAAEGHQHEHLAQQGRAGAGQGLLFQAAPGGLAPHDAAGQCGAGRVSILELPRPRARGGGGQEVHPRSPDPRRVRDRPLVGAAGDGLGRDPGARPIAPRLEAEGGPPDGEGPHRPHGGRDRRVAHFIPQVLRAAGVRGRRPWLQEARRQRGAQRQERLAEDLPGRR
mmetsp:Transcript_73785/g.213497  ORF Transcript_73785/g.213497 Transcript_73785/m.213497 type:complete len:714 (+) Transcript_73785:971-3112(+)